MIVQSCANNKVLLRFDTDFVARKPITSQNLEWIRNRAGQARRGPGGGMILTFREFVPEYWYVQGVPFGPSTVAADGLITVTTGLRLMRVWVAHELVQYPGALNVIMRFERLRLDAAEDGAAAPLRKLA